MRAKRGVAKCIRVVAGTLALLAGTVAVGRDSEGQPDRSAATRHADEATARAVARVALVDLRALAAPGGPDYRIAAGLLRTAHRLAPDDQDILRLTIDALAQAGDDEGVIEFTRLLLKMEPQDTVAQLRLISAQVARAQDVRARLALYDNFLGPRGESLDAAIRSRLALDAALLLRENGDTEGFVERLRQAVKLDSTNKDAATLAYSFFSQRVQDPEARVETLIALLNADPTDAKFHESLARELALGGAHRAALRFFRLSASVCGLSDIRIETEMLAARLTQQWMVEGAESPLKEVNTELGQQRGRAEAMRKRAEEAGLTGRNLPDPMQLRVALDIEQVRLAAASASGDAATTTGSMTDMAASVGELRLAAADPAKRAPGLTEAKAKSEATFWNRELLWMRLWTGQQVEDAAKQIDELAKEDPEADLNVLRGWLSLRQGKRDDAMTVFQSAADKDIVALLGVGAVMESKDDKTGAAKQYAEVYRKTPGSLIGAWARTKSAALGGQDPKGPESAARLEALVSGIPAWLDEMAANPRRFEVLSVSVPTGELTPLGKAAATLRVRNISAIPLAMGPDRPINSRILIAPSVSIPGVNVGEAALPEVVNIDRRLRLMPREEFVVTVWVDAGFGGWALEQLSSQATRIRWRIEQGFRVDAAGTTRGSGLGLATETPGVVRLGPAGAEVPFDDLIKRVNEAAWEQLPDALAALRVRVVGVVPGAARPNSEEMNKACAALGQRYGKAGPTARLLMLAMLPTGRREPGMLPFDRAIKDIDETDADVMSLKLVVLADEPDHPLLDKAITSGDERLRTLAESLRERLKTGARGYSRMTAVSLSPATK